MPLLDPQGLFEGQKVSTVSRSAVEVPLAMTPVALLWKKSVLPVIARHGQGKYGGGGYPSARRIVRKASISLSTLHSRSRLAPR